MRWLEIRDQLKKDISDDLGKTRISTKGKSMKEVQDMAWANNIPIQVEDDEIKEGWVGKLKGL